MRELLKVGLFVAFKVKSSWKKDTYWVAGRIMEIRSDSYLLRLAFNADLPFKFKEIVNIKVLEH